MTGGPEEQSPHDAFYYYSGNQLQAVRSGNWKLRRGGAARFYDLYERLTDSRNLRESHRDIYQRLVDAMNNLDAESLNRVHQEVSQMDDLAERHRDLVRQLVDRMKTVDEIELFNLQLDVSERRNVADANPDVVRALFAKLQNFDRELKANARPAGRWVE